MTTYYVVLGRTEERWVHPHCSDLNNLAFASSGAITIDAELAAVWASRWAEHHKIQYIVVAITEEELE